MYSVFVPVKPRIKLKPRLRVHAFDRERIDSVVHELRRALEMAERGELVEVAISGSLRGGSFFWSRSSTSSRSRVAGQLLFLAIKVLGFDDVD